MTWMTKPKSKLDDIIHKK